MSITVMDAHDLEGLSVTPHISKQKKRACIPTQPRFFTT